MLEQTIKNLSYDVSLVQLYIKTCQDAGFTDMRRLLESLCIQLFKASHGLVLKNKNLLNPNFPAIDLVDDAQRTAVQVTSNADSRKIRHTLTMFENHKLAKDYDALMILGFLKSSKTTALPSYCTVLSIGQLVSAVADKNDDDLVQHIVDALQQHTDFSRIHPYDDRNCLEIVLNCIDRNAIKHRMSCEGNYHDMVKGLNEITELISKGTINNRSKGKALDDFQDGSIKRFLIAVRDTIGRIVAIVNQCRHGESSFVDIPGRQMREIDEMKMKIICLANEIAHEHGLLTRIHMM